MFDVIKFEIELANVGDLLCYFFSLNAISVFVSQIMTPPHERRNFSKIYQKFPLEELQASVPDFNFTQYLDIVLPGQNYNPEKVVIYAMEYFRKLTKIVHKTSKRIVANYILMRFISCLLYTSDAADE